MEIEGRIITQTPTPRAANAAFHLPPFSPIHPPLFPSSFTTYHTYSSPFLFHNSPQTSHNIHLHHRSLKNSLTSKGKHTPPSSIRIFPNCTATAPDPPRGFQQSGTKSSADGYSVLRRNLGLWIFSCYGFDTQQNFKHHALRLSLLIRNIKV